MTWFPRMERAEVSIHARIASSITPVTLLAARAARKMATFFNDSTAALFLKCGSGVSEEDYTVKMESGDYFELPHPTYTGIVEGMWDGVNGGVDVTEFM